MTNLTTYNQKIFAGSTGLTGILGEFGSYKEGSFVATNDVDDIQTTRWEQGWFSSFNDSNNVPLYQDLNSFFYVVSNMIAYLNQGFNINEWSSEINYQIGSQVIDSSGNIFTSKTDSNLNNALSDLDHWLLSVGSKSIVVTTDYTVAYDISMIFCDSYPAANLRIDLPDPSKCKGRSIYISNRTGSGPRGMVIYSNNSQIFNLTIAYRMVFKIISDDSGNWSLMQSASTV